MLFIYYRAKYNNENSYTLKITELRVHYRSGFPLFTYYLTYLLGTTTLNKINL